MKRLANKPGHSRRPLMIVALSIAVTALATTAVARNGSVERDLTIDRQLGALRDPLLTRTQTREPRGWPGPRGEQPFDQEPPAAQGDFARPDTNEGGGQNPN